MNNSRKHILFFNLAALITIFFPIPGYSKDDTRAALRVTCDAPDEGAEIRLNGVVQGECSLDISLKSGSYTLKVIKKIDSTHDSVFEQKFRLADGTAKKIVVIFPPPTLNELARISFDSEEKKRQAMAEADLKNIVRLAQSGDQSAKSKLQSEYTETKSGCLIINFEQIPIDTVSWSLPCQNKIAKGNGVIEATLDKKLVYRYEGEVNASAADGLGKMTYSDGATYTGSFRNGRLHGTGIYVSAKTGRSAEFVYEDGKRIAVNWVKDAP